MARVVNGVSTRKIWRMTEELCGTAFSQSTVSKLAKGLEAAVQPWRTRSLAQTRYPFPIVDALVLKIRKHGAVWPRSGCVVMGINAAGYREILGFWIGDSQSQQTWTTVLTDLKDRGLTGVALVVSDSHRKLQQAIEQQFQGTSWQRCQTHLTRNVLDASPKAVQEELHGRLRALFEAPHRTTVDTLWAKLLEDFAERAPRAAAPAITHDEWRRAAQCQDPAPRTRVCMPYAMHCGPGTIVAPSMLKTFRDSRNHRAVACPDRSTRYGRNTLFRTSAWR
jgi:putative transposase